MKFSGNVNNGMRNRWLHIAGDLDHRLDIEIFTGFLINALISHSGGIGHWGRSALCQSLSSLLYIYYSGMSQ